MNSPVNLHRYTPDVNWIASAVKGRSKHRFRMGLANRKVLILLDQLLEQLPLANNYLIYGLAIRQSPRATWVKCNRRCTVKQDALQKSLAAMLIIPIHFSLPHQARYEGELEPMCLYPAF